MEPDVELIHAIRRGDGAAVAVFYDRHFPSVGRYACWRLNDDIDAAEDVTSETFLDAIRGIRNGEPRVPRSVAVDGWLIGIARNKAADVVRRRCRANESLAVVRDTRSRWGGEDFRPDANLQSRETRAQVLHAMSRLIDEERLALELKYIEGLSVQEIAARIARSAKAVESLLFRGRRSFRDAYRQVAGIQPGQERVR